MSSIITARRLLGAAGIIDYPVVEVDDGYITRILRRETHELPGSAASAVEHSFPEATLVPAFLDIHIHGAAGHDVMDGTSGAICGIGSFLASRGVGGFFPTTMASSIEETLRVLDKLADVIEEEPPSHGAIPLGIHLEGPFLSPAKRGVHPAVWLRQPSIAVFERFWQAAHGRIHLMTIAPELKDAPELIHYASQLGVKCSFGHSDATALEAQAGFQAGGRSTTHTFNAMRGLDHRDPGLVGYVLDNEELFAEIICDGIHVDPAIIRLFFKAKGATHSILVTDGISATGMPDGRYKLGDLEVDVHNGRCTSGGILAGSVLTMDQAVRNFSSFTRTSMCSAVNLATRNPARLMGLDHQWGVLEEGRQANITVLSPSGEIVQSFRAGRPVPG